jgi:hypothetical protein
MGPPLAAPWSQIGPRRSTSGCTQSRLPGSLPPLPLSSLLCCSTLSHPPDPFPISSTTLPCRHTHARTLFPDASHTLAPFSLSLPLPFRFLLPPWAIHSFPTSEPRRRVSRSSGCVSASFPYIPLQATKKGKKTPTKTAGQTYPTWSMYE